MELSEKDTIKFWKKVDKKGLDECWPWTGSVVNNIPVFMFDYKDKRHKNIRADKMMFILNTNIDISGSGYKVVKICKNPICCNPGHIEHRTCNSFDDPNYIHKFWEKVDIRGVDDCWNWIAYKNCDGYGVSKVKVDGIWDTIFSHRVSYYLNYGVFIDGENRCLHKCDNPSCVNPNHLFIGTQGDNVRDMHEKNRHVISYGSNSGKAKLNEDQVLEIKKMLSEGVSYGEISEIFNVTRENIGSIKNGNTWARVKYNEQ